MKTYVRRYTTVRAVRWYKLGDCPEIEPLGPDGPDPDEVCAWCSRPYNDHGWCKDDHDTVCPGDWIVEEKGADGPRIRVMGDGLFRRTFKPVEDGE